LAWSLLRYTPLDVPARLGIARALSSARSALGSDESFACWLRRNGQGDDAIRAFWEPFVVPALNAPLDRVSASDAAFVLVTAFLGDPGAARFGWSTVPLVRIAEAAAQRLDRVHTSTPVHRFDAGKNSIDLLVGNGERRAFDAVVLALPPAQLARLLEEPGRFGVPPLDDYEARAIVDIHLWHDRGPLDFDFAALLDSPVQWIFQKAADYLCCSVSAADAYLTAPTAELAARAWSEVCAAIPALHGARLVRSAVTRNPNGTYLPRAGVRRPSVRTTLPNLALAGSWLDTGWPDTMESAVRSGIAAAAALHG
jgi:hydroxysqualene dehydroxylase